MSMAKKPTSIGHYAFLVGVLIAVLAGLLGGVLNIAFTSAILVLLGLIVGFLNITRKETTTFLVAAIALIMIGTAGITAVTSLLGFIPYDLGEFITAVLANLVAFVSPAALIVALKAVWKIEEK